MSFLPCVWWGLATSVIVRVSASRRVEFRLGLVASEMVWVSIVRSEHDENELVVAHYFFVAERGIFLIR